MEDHQFTLNKSPAFVIIAAALLFCALQSCSDRGNLSDHQSILRDATESSGETPLSQPEAESALHTITPLLQPEAESALRTIMLQFPEYLDVGLKDAVEKIETLRTSSNNFLDNTGTETLAAVRAAWLSAHNAYEQTTLYRKLFESFAEEPAVLQLTEHQYFIDHWPIYAGYIDYLDSYPGSGLVNDMTVALTPESIRAQHGLLDIHEATLGFHALEFQLWGENVNGVDARPYDDFIKVTDVALPTAIEGVPAEQLPRSRRRQFLALGVEELSSETDSLFKTWNSERPSILAALEQLDSRTIIYRLAGAFISTLDDEILLPSLYPMLNGDYNEGLHAAFSHASQDAVSAQLFGMEQLLTKGNATGRTLDEILSTLSSDYAEYFLRNLDAGKACLDRLYSKNDSSKITDNEFAVVECINLMQNMIEYLEQIRDLTAGPA